jgi:hypothetical protein
VLLSQGDYLSQEGSALNNQKYQKDKQTTKVMDLRERRAAFVAFLQQK